jgi:two-component system LytT family response regulator
MTPLQVAIVDDEPLARARLQRLLAQVAGDSVVVALDCANVDELLAAAPLGPLDVLFLDIRMPGGDGFSALERWPAPRPRVVFVTGYQEHAARAFDVHAVDYLLKPVSAERLRETLDRLRQPIGSAGGGTGAPAPQLPDTLPLPVGRRIQLVPVDQIDTVEAQGNYLEIRAAERCYVIRRTLASFEAELDPARFMRLHRSLIVRIGAIREIRPVGSGRFRIELHGGGRVQSGRNFRDRVLALVGRQKSPS